MKKLFLKVIALLKCLGVTIIVVEQILKFIEMVLKFGNDFEISEFYRLLTFPKSSKMMRLFLKFSNFLENESGRGSCPSSSPSGNQVDGSPLVAIPKQLLSGPEGAAARRYS